MNKTLYIYSGTSNKSVSNFKSKKVYTYFLNTGEIISNNSTFENLNNSNKVNEYALTNKDKYINFIYNLNNEYLKKNILLDKKLSIYFLSDLSCKRSEFFSTYSNYINLLIIKDSINKNLINNVILDNCDKLFVISFKKLFPNILVSVINQKNNKFNYLKYILSDIHFYSKTFIKILFNTLFLRKKLNKKFRKLYLTRYPLQKDDEFIDVKFTYLAKNGCFLVDMITDGYHQNLSILNYFNYKKQVQKNNIIIDDFISFFDFFKCIAKSIFYKICYRNIFQNLNLNGVDLTDSLNFESNFSFHRLPRLFLKDNALRKILYHTQVSEFYYYLHEYPYGRYITYFLNNNFPKIQKISFQSGPSSYRKMLYFVSKKELSNDSDYLNNFCIPDIVYAEDSYSLSIYKNSNYKNLKLMEKIPRLHYLQNFKKNRGINKYHVIAPGLHDGEFLLNLIIKKMNKINKKFILKPHPRANNSYIKKCKNIENLEVFHGPIYNLLSKTEKIYATYSSIAVEAKLCGIDVELIDLPGKINESPLLDNEFLDIIDNLQY